MQLFGYLIVVVYISTIAGRRSDIQSQFVRSSEGCGESDVSVQSDEECVSVMPIPRYDDKPGSLIQYRCKARLTSLPKAKIDFCPVQICQNNLTWSIPSLSCAKSECVSPDKQYEGRRKCTRSGVTCQPWSSQSPHKHNYTMASSFPDHSVTAASNYCRDPDRFHGNPWCFTQDPITDWEYCGIPDCDELPLEENPCSSRETVDCGLPNFEVEADNNCVVLSPLQPFDTTKGSIIVYSCASLQQDIQSNTGYCPIEVCQTNGRWRTPHVSCAETECYINGRSKNYYGKRTCTSKGVDCIEWQKRQKLAFDNSSFPDGSIIAARSFCRDPSGDMGSPWCYTDDVRDSWGFCDIPKCADIPVEKTKCTGASHATDKMSTSSYSGITTTNKDKTDNMNILLSTTAFTITTVISKQLSTTVSSKTSIATDTFFKSTDFKAPNTDRDSPTTLAKNTAKPTTESENTAELSTTGNADEFHPTSTPTKNAHGEDRVHVMSSVTGNWAESDPVLTTLTSTKHTHGTDKVPVGYGITRNTAETEPILTTSTSTENTHGTDKGNTGNTAKYDPVLTTVISTDNTEHEHVTADDTRNTAEYGPMLTTVIPTDNTEQEHVTAGDTENTAKDDQVLTTSIPTENTDGTGQKHVPTGVPGNTARFDQILTSLSNLNTDGTDKEHVTADVTGNTAETDQVYVASGDTDNTPESDSILTTPSIDTTHGTDKEHVTSGDTDKTHESDSILTTPSIDTSHGTDRVHSTAGVTVVSPLVRTTSPSTDNTDVTDKVHVIASVTENTDITDEVHVTPGVTVNTVEADPVPTSFASNNNTHSTDKVEITASVTKNIIESDQVLTKSTSTVNTHDTVKVYGATRVTENTPESETVLTKYTSTENTHGAGKIHVTAGITGNTYESDQILTKSASTEITHGTGKVHATTGVTGNKYETNIVPKMSTITENRNSTGKGHVAAGVTRITAESDSVLTTSSLENRYSTGNRSVENMVNNVENTTDNPDNMVNNVQNTTDNSDIMVNNVENTTDNPYNIAENKGKTADMADNNENMTNNTGKMADVDIILTNSKVSVVLQTFDQASHEGNMFVTGIYDYRELTDTKAYNNLLDIITSVRRKVEHTGDSIEIKNMSSKNNNYDRNILSEKVQTGENFDLISTHASRQSVEGRDVESVTVHTEGLKLSSGTELFTQGSIIDEDYLLERPTKTQPRNANLYISLFQSLTSFIRISGEAVGVSVTTNVSDKRNIIDCARDCGKKTNCSIFGHHVDRCVLMTFNSTDSFSMNCETKFLCYQIKDEHA